MRISQMLATAAVALSTLAGCANTQADDTGANGREGDDRREASFHARNAFEVTVPEGAKTVRIWIAVPQKDPAQEVAAFEVDAPYEHRMVKDAVGNEFLFIEANAPKEATIPIVTTFTVTRAEVRADVDPAKTRPLTDADRAAEERWLRPSKHVIIDDAVRATSKEATGGEQNPVIASRKIYDWVLNNIDYWVKDPKNKKASPVGSTEHCLTTKTGNCTDFHSLYASLSRAAGIPTRIVYGSLFKPELEGKDVDQSYHCWIEFYAPDLGWIPLDVAVADIFVGDFEVTDDNGTLVSRTTANGYDGKDQGKVDFYFGNLEERRVTWNRGRDLELDPKQAGGPVNALPKAWVEVDGRPHNDKGAWTRKLTFTQ